MKNPFSFFLLVIVLQGYLSPVREQRVAKRLLQQSYRSESPEGKWVWSDCRDSLIVVIKPVVISIQHIQVADYIGWVRYVENGKLVTDNLYSANKLDTVNINLWGNFVTLPNASSVFFLKLFDGSRRWIVTLSKNKKQLKMTFKEEDHMIKFKDDRQHTEEEKYMGRSMPKEITLRKMS